MYPFLSLISAPLFLHNLKKSIRSLRVEYLIAGHYCDQILCITQVNDIVCPAGNHVDSFNLIAGHFKIDDLVRADLAFLDQAVTSYNNEELPLGVVPVLALGDARTADVDADLPTILSMYQLRETAAIIHIHLQCIFKFLSRQISQI